MSPRHLRSHHSERNAKMGIREKRDKHINKVEVEKIEE